MAQLLHMCLPYSRFCYVHMFTCCSANVPGYSWLWPQKYISQESFFFFSILSLNQQHFLHGSWTQWSVTINMCSSVNVTVLAQCGPSATVKPKCSQTDVFKYGKRRFWVFQLHMFVTAAGHLSSHHPHCCAKRFLFGFHFSQKNQLQLMWCAEGSEVIHAHHRSSMSSFLQHAL